MLLCLDFVWQPKQNSDFYHILKYRKSDNIETIKINLNSDNNLTAVLYANIGKGNFLGAIPKETIYDSKNIISEFNVPNEILDDDETFNILVRVKNNATLYVEIISFSFALVQAT